MENLHLFDAAKWLADKANYGANLSPDAIHAVASFTTMWNFFESTLCENRASVVALERISRRLEEGRITLDTQKALDECLAFWQSRYSKRGDGMYDLNGLCFRQNDKRQHVEAVLGGDLLSPKCKLLASLIIIFRLRNNLFHGLKSIDMLNDQVENLNVASRCLAAILEAIPSRFILSASSNS